MSPVAGDRPAPVERPWWKLLGAAGSIGLAVFFLGSAAIWMHLKLFGVPADTALGAMAPPTVLSISIRGVFAVAAAATLVGLVVFRFWVWVVVLPLRPLPRLVPTWVAGAYAVVLVAIGDGSDPIHPWSLSIGWISVVLAGVAYWASWKPDLDVDRRVAHWLFFATAVYESTWVSWGMLGLSLGLAIADQATQAAMASALRDGTGFATAALALLFAALIGAMVMQVGERLPLSEVTLSRVPLADQAYPYLGEKDGYVYVVEAARCASGDKRYGTHVLTFKREDYTLRFGESGTLNPLQLTPGRWLFDLAHHVPLRPAGPLCPSTASSR